MNGKPKTARSYRGAILDDNAIISINLRWLFQAAVVIAGLVYSYLEIKESAATNERRIAELEERVSDLKSIHDAEMKEIEAWYKKSLDINPLNIFGKQKRK